MELANAIRDYVLSWPWLSIVGLGLFVLVVVLLVKRGPDGEQVLVAWACRLFDVFVPGSKGANKLMQRRLDREVRK